MIESNNFRHLGFRNEVTEMILETLAILPETQRNIFVWRHYRGHQVKQIATVLGSNCLEVEATLEAINSILCQRTRSLIAKDSLLEPEVDSGVMRQGIERTHRSGKRGRACRCQDQLTCYPGQFMPTP